MQTTSFRLPAPLAERLREAARARGVTTSVIAREALEAWLADLDGPSVVAEIDALVDYPGSGLGDRGRRGEEILRDRFRRRPR